MHLRFDRFWVHPAHFEGPLSPATAPAGMEVRLQKSTWVMAALECLIAGGVLSHGGVARPVLSITAPALAVIQHSVDGRA